MRFWLISDEDIEAVRQALMSGSHEAIFVNCEDGANGEPCQGCAGDTMRRDGLHSLDTGLHITDQVPVDYQ